jgi:hypothetical protein
VGRQRIIERERRWAVPAAVAAVSMFVLFVVSVVIQQAAGISTSVSEAVVERSIHDHTGTIIAVSVVRAISFLLLPIPLLYLFRAAQARNPRVRATMVGFVFIGPILFAAQGVVGAIGQNQAASEFVKQAPHEQAPSYASFQKQLKSDPASIEKVTIYTVPNQLEVQQTNGAFYKVDHYPAAAEGSLPSDLDQAKVDNETDSDTDSQAGDALATHITDGTGAVQVAGALAIPALLGLVVLMVYVPLQAQRVGLLSRFFGSLGMAFGAAILILPPALFGVIAWIGYLGLLFVGRVPGGRPPAWEAGEAAPWLRPGDEGAPSPSGEAVEGEGTEVGAGDGASPAPNRAGQPSKRKRKRRR